MHVCGCALMPLLVPLLQRWTEDEQAQEELPGSRPGSAAIWSRCPQVSFVLHCEWVCLWSMNACVPVAGFCLLTYLMLLAGMVLKGLKRYPRLSRLFLCPTNTRILYIHIHIHVVCTIIQYIIQSLPCPERWECHGHMVLMNKALCSFAICSPI